MVVVCVEIKNRLFVGWTIAYVKGPSYSGCIGGGRGGSVIVVVVIVN